LCKDAANAPYIYCWGILKTKHNMSRYNQERGIKLKFIIAMKPST
jgi:hypothetical protein